MAEGVQVLVLGSVLSPFSRRVELALKLKGVDYEYIDEASLNKKKSDLVEKKKKKRSDLVLKYNPIYKKVPVLVHNGNPILESLIILEYIDENWKTNPIFPQHPLQRARARFWAKYIDDKFYFLWLKAARSGRGVRNRAIEEACKALEPLENELKSNNFDYFGGESIGFVDIAAIFVAYWVPVMQQALGFQIMSSHRFPKLTKWSEQLVSNSVVMEILPPKDDIFAYTQIIYKTNMGNSKL